MLVIEREIIGNVDFIVARDGLVNAAFSYGCWFADDTKECQRAIAALSENFNGKAWKVAENTVRRRLVQTVFSRFQYPLFLGPL